MLPKSYSPDCGNTNWKPPSPLYDSTLPAERSLSYRSPIQSSRETGKIFYKRNYQNDQALKHFSCIKPCPDIFLLFPFRA